MFVNLYAMETLNGLEICYSKKIPYTGASCQHKETDGTFLKSSKNYLRYTNNNCMHEICIKIYMTKILCIYLCIKMCIKINNP